MQRVFEVIAMPLIVGLGPTEIVIVLLIVLLLFGGRKIPELFRGLGEGVREFKRGTQEADNPSGPASEAAKPGEPKSPDA